MRLAPKRSASGAAQRLALLTGALGVGPEALDDPVLATVPMDDALDALAGAWSARRYASGEAVLLGETDGTSSTTRPVSLRMRIAV